jgi:uncharacterized phage protein gp47/JayE
LTTYGLTSTGFVTKPLLTIKSDLEDALKAVFGASIDLAPQSVFGQWVGITAERLSEIWDAAEADYAAFDPDGATDAALDALCAITGTVREPASHSTVTLTLGGDAGTPIPAGSQVSVSTTGVKFETLALATCNSTPTTVNGVTVGGSTTGAAQAVDTGPLVAAAGSITVIETPVSGWTAVTNAADAVSGQDIETDADLRLRREVELHSAANAALEAIRNAVLDVDNVSECKVFENTTMVTDGDGIPAKSIEVVISGTGTAADIEEAIFSAVAAGIGTYGTVTGTVIDTQGIAHMIKHSTATEIDAYIRATVTYNADDYEPATGDDLVAAAILDYGTDHLVMGKDVVPRAVGSGCFAVTGVIDCAIEVGTMVGTLVVYSSSTLAVGLREVAVLASARVTVVSSAGTP